MAKSGPSPFLARLAALVAETNRGLEKRWRNRLKFGAGRPEAVVAAGLWRKGGPFIAKLSVTMEGHQPLPLKCLWRPTAPDKGPLRLGRPVFWRRLLKLHHPKVISFQIVIVNGRQTGRVIVTAFGAEGEKL